MRLLRQALAKQLTDSLKYSLMGKTFINAG